MFVIVPVAGVYPGKTDSPRTIVTRSGVGGACSACSVRSACSVCSACSVRSGGISGSVGVLVVGLVCWCITGGIGDSSGTTVTMY